ncbi:MAG: hypothetical protein IPN60_10920 [Saprospiraceae bacterium]|nr:hypothetical protein [Candidatus Opimibacter skivensis]
MLKIADYRPDMLAESFKGVTTLHSKGILNPHIGAIFNETNSTKPMLFRRQKIYRQGHSEMVRAFVTKLKLAVANAKGKGYKII